MEKKSIKLEKQSSRQKVIDAASLLFYQKGYHGTSVRDIAEEASVNVSLISYYFKGKQGLFEHAVIDYYETYLANMEEKLNKLTELSPMKKLKRLIRYIIQYKHSRLQLSCLIHRELSLDSVFVREMTVTYLAKENYILGKVFYEVLKERRHLEKNKYILFLQLKGMIATPYMLHNEWKYQVIGEQSHQFFLDNYLETIYGWLDFIIKNQS